MDIVIDVIDDYLESVENVLCQIFSSRLDEGGEEKTGLTRNDEPRREESFLKSMCRESLRWSCFNKRCEIIKSIENKMLIGLFSF